MRRQAIASMFFLYSREHLARILRVIHKSSQMVEINAQLQAFAPHWSEPNNKVFNKRNKRGIANENRKTTMPTPVVGRTRLVRNKAVDARGQFSGFPISLCHHNYRPRYESVGCE